MRVWLLLFVFFLNQNLQAQVLGYVDKVDRQGDAAIVRGWACVRGLNQNIEVRIFAGGPAGRGVLIARARTHSPSSSTIHSQCRTPSERTHRFNIVVPGVSLQSHQGKKIYAHGISPISSNLLLSRSGEHSLPTVTRSLRNVPFLADVHFNRGVRVKDPQITNQYLPEYYTLHGHRCQRYRNVWNGRTHDLHFANSNPHNHSPAWTLAQWDSQANLYPGFGQRINNGTYAWENIFKLFQIGKPGYGHRTLTLGVDGHREYNGRWFTSADPCVETPHPHLLVEQSIPAVKDRSLGSLQKLLFTLKGRVLTQSLASHLHRGWNKNTNTAHFKVHINMQNIRSDRDVSKGHGQSFGIGINYFDVRNRDSDYAETVFFHRPRRRVMLNLSINHLGQSIRSKLHSGGWGEINRKDILPMVKRAFQAAIKAGKSSEAVDRLISENLNDYYITNFNMGWEVSSPHVVEMQVSDIELFAQKY